MTLADLLAESKTFSLDLFPPGTVANVEKRFDPASEDRQACHPLPRPQ